MNLWSADSIIDVFKNLVAGLAGQWIPKGCRWGTPNRSSISGARQRVGSRVMTRLFEKLAKPLATLQTPGAFLNGLRWMAIDGTLFDLPDTDSSKTPRLVVQEIYGWLLAHWAVRCLMFKASTDAGISPLRLGFTGSLRVLRRAIPLFQQVSTPKLPLFVSWLMSEILEQEIPPRQGRINPRVVKKPRSKFKSKKRSHRSSTTQLQPLTFAPVPSAA